MSYPCDGIPRPGMEVPGMCCPSCGRPGVYWIAGEDVSLGKPRPHFQCNTCRYTFAGKYPAKSREHSAGIKRPLMVNLWRNC